MTLDRMPHSAHGKEVRSVTWIFRPAEATPEAPDININCHVGC